MKRLNKYEKALQVSSKESRWSLNDVDIAVYAQRIIVTKRILDFRLAWAFYWKENINDFKDDSERYDMI